MDLRTNSDNQRLAGVRGVLVARRESIWSEVWNLIQMLPEDHPVAMELRLQAEREKELSNAITGLDAGDYELAKKYFADLASAMHESASDDPADAHRFLEEMSKSYIETLEQLERQRT